jgi:hypothetical protein
MPPKRDERVPLPKRIEQMLTEARVILPGAQALLGFQLAVVLTDSFRSLSFLSQEVHGAALASVALCTILLMAPAAYHRIVYQGEASEGFLLVGSRFLLAATGALAAGLAADAFVVMGKIADSNKAGLIAAVAAFIALTGLWHLSPLLLRRARSNSRCRGRAGGKQSLEG